MEVKPGYKQTEVGIIPEDWDVKPLESLGSVIRGASPRPKSDKRFYGGDIPRLMVEDVTRDKKLVTPRIDFLTAEGAKRSRPCKRGTLTVVCSGTPAVVGLPSFLAVDACIHDGMMALVNTSPSVVPDYLFHQLTSYQEQLYMAATHGGTFVNLTTSGLRAFQVALPPNTNEQRAIAESLSDVDALQVGLDGLIAKKRDLKQAVVQQLLTGRTRLPGFHDEWKVRTLGEVATFLKGKALPKSALVLDGTDPCIHYGELFTHYPETVGEIISRTNASRDVFRSIANDVLMPTSDVTPRGLAKASCVPMDGVVLGGDILVIRTDARQVNGTFLSYIIRRGEDQVLRLVTGSTVYHLYGSDMKEFTFLMPPFPEQNAIAEVLTDMDADMVALEQRREKTRHLKQGMMQELLTGKIRLI